MLELILQTEEPDPNKKGCSDCYYMRAAVSWWCKNKEAIQYRSTSIPNCKGCKFWKPARQWKDLPWYEKLYHHIAGPLSNYIVV